uniref:Uncharacterized protein n=2 Tax=Cacopsylla melanoneura TaxID=428564 RepID=A0A8D8VUY8_9HEMI
MDGIESIRKCSKYRHPKSSHWMTKDSNNIRDTTSEENLNLNADDQAQSKVTKSFQNLFKMYYTMLDNVSMTSRSTNAVKLIAVLVILGFVNTSLAASVEGEENQNSFNSKDISKDKPKSGRGGKSLFFNNPLTDLYFNNQYQNEELLGGNNEDYMENTEDDMMSRARPLGNNKKKYENSPIYYIRIPPSPYVHVPGYGYVSETPSLKPPPQVVQNDPSPNEHTYNQQNTNKYNHQQNTNQYNQPNTNQYTHQQNTNQYNQQNYMQNQNTYQEPSQPNYNNNNYMSNLMGAMSNYMNFNPAPATNSYYPTYQNPLTNLAYQNDQYSPSGAMYPANTFPLNTPSAHNKYQNSPVYNLPLQFLANGKPTNIYTLPNEIQSTPMKPSKPTRPDSPIYHLDKGPYVFNGKPADVILLRDAYNALYDDTINNFYP